MFCFVELVFVKLVTLLVVLPNVFETGIIFAEIKGLLVFFVFFGDFFDFFPTDFLETFYPTNYDYSNKSRSFEEGLDFLGFSVFVNISKLEGLIDF